jgi:hypothetical protein
MSAGGFIGTTGLGFDFLLATSVLVATGFAAFLTAGLGCLIFLACFFETGFCGGLG